MGIRWWIVGLALVFCGAVSLPGNDGEFVGIDSGMSSSLRGMSIVDDRVVWVSGAKGTVLLSVDGGEHFKRCSVAGHEQTDFRDMHGIDEKTAVIMAAGAPPVLLRTEDGGVSWREVFRHPDPTAFFDSMTIREDGVGLVLADPLDGRWLMLETEDHGRTWIEVAREKSPASAEGEHAFAASGSLIAIDEAGKYWLGLGGSGAEGVPQRARVLRGDSRSGTWTSLATPMVGGTSAGIFALARGAGGRIGIVGGDYQDESVAPAAAYSDDDGTTWTVPESSVRGYRSSLVIQPRGGEETWFACGPTGIDVSDDRGATWRGCSDVGYHVIGFSKSGNMGLAIGSEGRIARWVPSR